MILQRATIIETGTAITATDWGLYSGYFAWVTGREIEPDPTFPVGPWGTQEDWAFDMLAISPFTGPNLSARIGPTGGYSTMGSLDIQIAKVEFIEFLRTRGIKLTQKRRVWHYLVMDGVWNLWFVGVVDNVKYKETGVSISCIDQYKIIHQDIPRSPITAAAFPDLDPALVGSFFPVSLGYINNAKPFKIGLLNPAPEFGKQIVLTDGSYSATITSAAQQKVPGSAAPIHGSSLNTVNLIIGDLPLPDWVGKTLVVTQGSFKKAYKIASMAGSKASTYVGETVLGIPVTVETIAVTIEGVSASFSDSQGNPVNPVLWFPDRVNEPRTGTELTWLFEVFDFTQERIISQRKIYGYVANLKTYNSTLEKFTDAPQVDATRYLQIPTRDQAGLVIKTNDASDPESAVREIISGYFTPEWAKFQGYNYYAQAGIISSTFPAIGDNLPNIIDRSVADGYELVVQGGVPFSNGREKTSILVEIPIPNIKLESGEEVYVCFDLVTAKVNDGIVTVQLGVGIRMEEMTTPYKRDLWRSSFDPVIVNPTNAIGPNGGYFFYSGTYYSNQSDINFLTIPQGYYSNPQATGMDANLYPLGVGPGLSNKYLRVTDVFKTPNNATKTLLVEILFNTGIYHHQYKFSLQEICFVKTRNALTDPPDVFNSEIGELYGDYRDDRNPIKPVQGIADIAEHIILAYDQAVDMIDEESFANAYSFRPALSPFGWFAGQELQNSENSVGVLDELMKNALLMMVPGLDGKRRLIAFFDRMQDSYVQITLDASKWSQGSLGEVESSDSQDTYSEFQINYDYNQATGQYNRNLQINNTDQDAFPDEDEDWQSWVVGDFRPYTYVAAKGYWDAAHAGYSETGTKNRLVLDCPWLTDQFNGDPWSAAVASTFLPSLPTKGAFPPKVAAQLLLSLLLRWAAFPKKYAGGRVPITAETKGLNLCDTVYFKDAVLTSGKRYFGWIVDMKVLESEIELKILWYPFNSPDESSFLAINDGYLVLDAGSDRVLLN